MMAVRRAAKTAARQVAFPAAESAWSLAFAAVGQVLRPSTLARPPAGTDRVLAIAPHPDDETLACGGMLALHRQAGDSVCVVIVTDGGSSRAGNRSREEMVRVRAREASAAIAELGIQDLVQLGLPEGRWQTADLGAHLSALLRQSQPTVIYAPSCVDFHPEHLRVAGALARALSKEDVQAAIRVYELQVPLTPLLANISVDVTQSARAKRRALGKYPSQRLSFDWVPRHKRYLYRLYRVKGPIEVFWEMSPREYIRLMSGYRTLKPAFRSIRQRPFSDGLAWLIGLRARARLKRLAYEQHD